MAEKKLLSRIGNWLQSGREAPLNPRVNELTEQDIERFFTRYGEGSPLSNALSTGMDRMEQVRPPSPAEEPIPGAAPTVIPKMDRFPVGQGSWFNRPKESALVTAQTSKFNEQDVQRAAEKSAIEKLVAENPKYFAARPADTFINVKQAEEFLKNEKKLELDREKLEEQKRRAKAQEKARAEKENNPFGPTLPSVPTIGATPPAVTAKDVLNKFGIEQ